MRRRSTIFSLPSLLIFGVLMAGLALAIWRQGGLAFSPGELSSTGNAGVMLAGFDTHADFENQCSYCHQPLKTLQAELCMECHTDIELQVKMENGLHGKFENIMKCAQCHTDHQGRAHDLRLGSLQDFEHSRLNFSLIWHQVDYEQASITCTGCHVADNQFSVKNEYCSRCHADADSDFIMVHISDFGTGCVDCHDGLDSLARFDHNNSEFQLLGVHKELTCAACHNKGQFQDLSQECVACHAEPPEHLGMFGKDCAACHDALAWKPVLMDGTAFDHNRDTRFALDLHKIDFDGAVISCTSCHQVGQDQFDQETCFGCHALDQQDFMLQHQMEFGPSCIECHDGIDRMRSFDHQEIFLLDGSHLELECQACHINQIYQGTPADCKDCHAEPEIHLGYFGLTCEYCHATSSWYPAQLTRHSFPLDHGEDGELACETCHATTYSEYTCFSCHEHSADEMVEKHEELNKSIEELSNCTACHLDGRVHEFAESED